MNRMGSRRGPHMPGLDEAIEKASSSAVVRETARDAATPPAARPESKARLPASLEDPEMREAKRRVVEHPPHVLSQTNRGLRMILIATVAVVAISWFATLGDRYITLLKIQELTKGDPNALRVMCAINPPTEHDVGLMHICEQAALIQPAEGPEQPTPSPRPKPK